MIVKNTTLERFVSYIQDKDVYIYGTGESFRQLRKRELYTALRGRVAGFIDTYKAGQIITEPDKSWRIQAPEFLKTVQGALVLICAARYMREMYETLCKEELPDTVECFLLPLVWAVSDGKDDDGIKKRMLSGAAGRQLIGKHIHCFWFSGEEKPPQYQRCIDSWKRVCPDYEITEWDSHSYDCEKNRFVKQAFEKRKWAFVSDYARLDVIYHYGGIYLDMDVALIKDFDPLLQFQAFFNFSTQFYIDLGSGFGSVAGNPFLADLLALYENQEFLDRDGNPLVWNYMQPAFLRDAFGRAGVRMNGDMQLVDGMLVLPRRYYTPVDDFLSVNLLQCEDTRGIHQYHGGWCTGTEDSLSETLSWLEIAGELEE